MTERGSASRRARAAGGLIGAALLGLLLLSCSGLPLRSDGPRGVYHRVKSGETLGAIARAYHVKLKDLAEMNGIANPDRLEADSVIFIPDVSQVVDDVLAAGQGRPAGTVPGTAERSSEAAKSTAATPAPPSPSQEMPGKGPPTPVEKAVKAPVQAKKPPALTKGEAASPAPPASPPGEATAQPALRAGEGDRKGSGIAAADGGRFVWPVRGKVISRFGDQPNRMRFNGIRIAAPDGTAVVAAAGGLVIYSAYLKGYGETVIIEHEDGFATVYTHLETRTVRKDQRVRKGDRIAFLGKAEDQEEPYLHFEIRYRYQARNPLSYLPDR